jgi:AcrR family transcriptional regulator
MIAYQKISEAIAVLSEEDKEELFEALRQRRVEMRRAEVLANAQALREAVANGTAFMRMAADLIAYLTEDDDEVY